MLINIAKIQNITPHSIQQELCKIHNYISYKQTNKQKKTQKNIKV